MGISAPLVDGQRERDIAVFAAVAGGTALIFPCAVGRDGEPFVVGVVVGLLIGLAGAGVGAWVSSMIGISTPSSRLTEFEKAIEAGPLLMMVDVPKDRVDDITTLVRSHHPEAHIEGTEPVIPAFP